VAARKHQRSHCAPQKRERQDVFNVAFLLTILVVRVAPFVVIPSLSENSALEFIYLTDQIVIILLSIFIYKGVSWKSYLTKSAILVLLVVSSYYLVNYILG
jgi:branched-subunit amino acid transport protein AzlD